MEISVIRRCKMEIPCSSSFMKEWEKYDPDKDGEKQFYHRKQSWDWMIPEKYEPEKDSERQFYHRKTKWDWMIPENCP